MYLYVSEIFPTEIRPIGMGFSLFGQFAGKSILIGLSIIMQFANYLSYSYSSGNRPNGLQRCRLEILPGHYLLVGLLHSR